MDNYTNIIVLGMGKSGLSAVRLLSYLKKNVYAINQGAPSSWSNHPILESLDEQHLLSQDDPRAKGLVASCDLVILSPGISRDVDLLSGCKCPIWSEIELGYQFCNSQIVGVTGTNGKTTTVSFLQECLELDGRPFFVGGNIGTPLCDYSYELLAGLRKEAWCILLELSSFQLESTFSFTPKIAAVLNITFSHGERYEELLDYANAKKNIFKKMSNGVGIWPIGLWQELSLAAPKLKKNIELDLTNSKHLKVLLAKFIDLDELKIYGEHNLYNLYFALTIWQELGGELSLFKAAARSFLGVEYRLESLGTYRGLKVFNDAKSTNWQATLTAVLGVRDLGDVHLVIGGQNRGEGDLDIESLDSVSESIKSIYLIGESGLDLMSLIGEKYETHYVGSLEELKIKIDSSELSGVLLFSPAFPSFDQFKNYLERGQRFSKLFMNNN